MLIRRINPLLFDALLKPPSCRIVASFPTVGGRSIVKNFLSIGRSASSCDLTNNNSQEIQILGSKYFSIKTFRTTVNNSSGQQQPPTSPTLGWGHMARKRTWAQKKDKRSRSFAKRGRVGGWGDYGPDGAGQPKQNNHQRGM